MSAAREAKGTSDTFRFECDECGAIYRARCDESHTAILMAARKGWTFAGRKDRCEHCKPAAPKRGSAGPKSR